MKVGIVYFRYVLFLIIQIECVYLMCITFITFKVGKKKEKDEKGNYKLIAKMRLF